MSAVRVPDQIGGSEWKAIAETYGWFTDVPANDGQVIWRHAPALTPPYQQVWPDPAPTRQIGAQWGAVGGLSAIELIEWEMVFDTISTPVHGDLVVEYTVRCWWDSSGATPAATFPGAGAEAVEQFVGRNVSWTPPAPLEVEDGNDYVIEVESHWRFFDGTAAVDQQPAVTRIAYTEGTAPVTPLPAPANLAIVWEVDTPGDVGYFRSAKTTAEMLLAQPRLPVAAIPDYHFPALGNKPAENLAVPTRDVDVTHTETLTTTRPAIPAATDTRYDFPAIGGLPAVTGWQVSERQYDEATQTPTGAFTIGPGSPFNFVVPPGTGTAVGLSFDLGLSGAPPNTPIVEPPNRNIEVVVGGSVIARLDTFGGVDLAHTIDSIALPYVRPGDTITLRLAGSGWGSWSVMGGAVVTTLQSGIVQTGTAVTTTIPWDGVPGHPGDPGGSSGTTLNVTDTVTQQGTRVDKWSGVPGDPGDPGSVDPQWKRKVWSWPFTVEFDAVPGAEYYEVKIGGGAWTKIPNVPASALGPGAAGAVSWTDRWAEQAPGHDVRVQVHGVKSGPNAGVDPDEPGFGASVTDTVPAEPTIGPVQNLQITNVGYRYATALWDEPAIDPAAAHYLSGFYQISVGGTRPLEAATRAWYADAGDVTVPYHGPFEGNNRTPSGNYKRLSTGKPKDTGAPTPDAPRSINVEVAALAGWADLGPVTTSAAMLLSKVVSYGGRSTIAGAQTVAPSSYRGPTTYTQPRVVSVKVGPDGSPGGNNRQSGTDGGISWSISSYYSAGVSNWQVLRTAAWDGFSWGGVGSSLELRLSVAGPNRAVNVTTMGCTPVDTFVRSWKASAYYGNTHRGTRTIPNKRAPGETFFLSSYGGSIGDWDHPINRVRCTNSAGGWKNRNLNWSIGMQKPPVAHLGALHHVQGTYRPPVVTYPVVLNAP